MNVSSRFPEDYRIRSFAPDTWNPRIFLFANRHSLLGLCFAALSLVGCGGSASPTNNAAPSSPPVATGSADSGHSAAPAATASVDPNHKETKWIGTIPYDVFFDQPLTIATDTTPVAGADGISLAANSAPTERMPTDSGGQPAADMPAQAPVAPEGSASAAAAIAWGDILPMPILIEEVKHLRTSLTGNLQTVATFNKSQNAIAQDGSILAAMACVAAAHPGDVSWKSKAPFVRDLAFQINANSTGSGREPYTKTKEPFDQILLILDGGKAPELDSPQSVPFAEVVYVSDMMKQIEASFNNLKANINTTARIKEDPANTERELRLLWTLATMMTDPSYDSADQQGYQDLLQRFNKGTRDGIGAVQKGNIEDFQAALNQIQTTCAECHQQYRGSSSGF